MKGTAIRRGELNAFIEQAKDLEKLFIGEKILPVLGVKQRAAEYPVLKKAAGKLMHAEVTKRNSTGTYNKISRKHTWDNYTCEDRGLEEDVDDTKVKEMADFFDCEVATTRLLGRSCKFDFERNVVARIFDTAVFPNAAAAVNYTTANAATVDAPADIMNAIEELTARGQFANTMVMSLNLFNYIRRSRLMQTYIFGSESSGVKVVKKSDMERVFGEEAGVPDMKILIGASVFNKANPGKESTVTTERCWPNSHIWLGNVQSGDFSNGGAGRTLSWVEDSPGANELFTTETYYEDTRRTTVVRVRSNSIEKITDEDAGQLIVTNRP